MKRFKLILGVLIREKMDTFPYISDWRTSFNGM